MVLSACLGLIVLAGLFFCLWKYGYKRLIGRFHSNRLIRRRFTIDISSGSQKARPRDQVQLFSATPAKFNDDENLIEDDNEEEPATLLSPAHGCNKIACSFANNKRFENFLQDVDVECCEPLLANCAAESMDSLEPHLSATPAICPTRSSSREELAVFTLVHDSPADLKAALDQAGSNLPSHPQQSNKELKNSESAKIPEPPVLVEITKPDEERGIIPVTHTTPRGTKYLKFVYENSVESISTSSKSTSERDFSESIRVSPSETDKPATKPKSDLRCPEADTGRERKSNDCDDLSNPTAIKNSKKYIQLTEDWNPMKFASNGLSDVDSRCSDESSSSGSYIELTEDWRPKDPSKLFASNGLSDVESNTADESSCSGDSSKVPSNNVESSIGSSDWNISAFERKEEKQKIKQNQEPTSPLTYEDLSEEHKEIAAKFAREVGYSKMPTSRAGMRKVYLHMEKRLGIVPSDTSDVSSLEVSTEMP